MQGHGHFISIIICTPKVKKTIRHCYWPDIGVNIENIVCVIPKCLCSLWKPHKYLDVPSNSYICMWNFLHLQFMLLSMMRWGWKWWWQWGWGCWLWCHPERIDRRHFPMMIMRKTIYYECDDACDDVIKVLGTLPSWTYRLSPFSSSEAWARKSPARETYRRWLWRWLDDDDDDNHDDDDATHHNNIFYIWKNSLYQTQSPRYWRSSPAP